MASQITITLPDGSSKKFAKGVTGTEIAKSIGSRLAKDALAIKVNEELCELSHQVEKDSKVRILTFEDAEGKQAFWHTSAHVLAQAVLELYPDALRTIGPAIENGFYFDFYRKEAFTPDDLVQIEKKMAEIVGRKLKLVRKDLTLKEAKAFYKGNKFKLELIDEFTQHGEKTISFYQQGDYMDLCKGGHVEGVEGIKAIKLTKISSAYWRGDAKNESLQRIYGVSFPTEKQLKEYLHMLEEAEKRDHRKIGAALDLFSFHDVSPGSPFFHPKGTLIFNTLVSFMREQYAQRGYREVVTPQLFHKSLWETSGHWQHYRQNMFLSVMDDADAGLKSMNCPSHILIYKTRVRSYRELPLRLADFSPLHRNEVRGTLGGLFRVRKFQQDDAHIFCADDQIESEVHGVISFVKYVYGVFGFDFRIELSTRPEKALGDPALWDKAEAALIAALEHAAVKYKVNPGDGAFYGPKIDFHVKDALGRSWQCGTIQLDFNQPERFGVEYDGTDGHRHRAVMIHRAIFGSLERFIGILTEHYAGKFPLWLNPNQIILLPIADRHAKYCHEAAAQFKNAGLRVAVDESPETTNKKIRDAQLQQYNYILVVGDRETQNKTVNVRTRDEKVHGEMKVDALIKQLLKEVELKK